MARRAQASKESKDFALQEKREARVHEAKVHANMKNAGRGMKHHCPIDGRPLTKPSAQLDCIGTHCMPCSKFHDTILRIGRDETCEGCQMCQRMQHDRYKNIATLLSRLDKHDAGETNSDEDLIAFFSDKSAMKKNRGRNPLKRAGIAGNIVNEQDISHVKQILDDALKPHNTLPEVLRNSQQTKSSYAMMQKGPEPRVVKAIRSYQEQNEAHDGNETESTDAMSLAISIFIALGVHISKVRINAAGLKIFEELDAAIAGDIDNKRTESAATKLREERFWAKIPGKAKIMATIAARKRSRENGLDSGQQH